MEIPPSKQDLGWFLHSVLQWETLLVCFGFGFRFGTFFSCEKGDSFLFTFQYYKNWKFSQAGLNHLYIEDFCLWVYFLNVFPSAFVMIFHVWNLVNLPEVKKEKLREKLLFPSLEMMPQIVLIFPVKKVKRWILGPKCCDLPVSPLLFRFLGPWHCEFWSSASSSASPPVFKSISGIYRHWILTEPLARRVGCKTRHSNKPKDVLAFLWGYYKAAGN